MTLDQFLEAMRADMVNFELAYRFVMADESTPHEMDVLDWLGTFFAFQVEESVTDFQLDFDDDAQLEHCPFCGGHFVEEDEEEPPPNKETFH